MAIDSHRALLNHRLSYPPWTAHLKAHSTMEPLPKPPLDPKQHFTPGQRLINSV